jgi:hypothetical protein
MTFGRVCDATALQDRVSAVVDFCCFLHNQFALLSPNFLDPEVEWSTLERKISKATRQVVGKAWCTCRHKPSLM